MATQTSMSIDDIIEAIGSLSVVELAELIEKFKGKFGVTIAAPVAAAPAAGGAGGGAAAAPAAERSEEHTSELQSLAYLVCRLLLGKKKKKSAGYSRVVD